MGALVKTGVVVIEWGLADNIDDEMFAIAVGHIVKDLVEELPAKPYSIVVATEGIAEQIVQYANILNEASGT